MELRQLAVVVAVAEEGGFTAAALRLRTVQSTVSTVVRALERDLGTPLFHRTTHRVVLTPAGEAFMPAARAALAAAARARAAVSPVGGRVRLGVCPGLLADWHRVLAALRDVHPGLAVEVRQVRPGVVERVLAESTVDVVLTVASGLGPGSVAVGRIDSVAGATGFARRAEPDGSVADRVSSSAGSATGSFIRTHDLPADDPAAAHAALGGTVGCTIPTPASPACGTPASGSPAEPARSARHRSPSDPIPNTATPTPPACCAASSGSPARSAHDRSPSEPVPNTATPTPPACCAASSGSPARSSISTVPQQIVQMSPETPGQNRLGFRCPQMAQFTLLVSGSGTCEPICLSKSSSNTIPKRSRRESELNCAASLKKVMSSAAPNFPPIPPSKTDRAPACKAHILKARNEASVARPLIRRLPARPKRRR